MFIHSAVYRWLHHHRILPLLNTFLAQPVYNIRYHTRHQKDQATAISILTMLTIFGDRACRIWKNAAWRPQ